MLAVHYRLLRISCDWKVLKMVYVLRDIPLANIWDYILLYTYQCGYKYLQMSFSTIGLESSSGV